MAQHPEVLAAASAVIDPELEVSLGAVGMVPEATLTKGKAEVTLAVPVTAWPSASLLREAIEQAVSVVPGVDSAYALSPETTLDFGIYDSKDSAAHYKVATMAGGVQYKFLKDLTLYGQYASAKNKGTKAASWNFAGPSSAFLTSAITAGQTASTINVGLLYAFF